MFRWISNWYNDIVGIVIYILNLQLFDSHILQDLEECGLALFCEECDEQQDNCTCKEYNVFKRIKAWWQARKKVKEGLQLVQRCGWDGICPECASWLHRNLTGTYIDTYVDHYIYRCDCGTISAWNVSWAPVPLLNQKVLNTPEVHAIVDRHLKTIKLPSGKGVELRAPTPSEVEKLSG